MNSEKFALMMVECELYSGIKGEVRGDVITGNVYFAVLHILGVNEFDLIDQIHFLQKHGTDKSVEITSCNKSSAHFPKPSLKNF